MPISDLGDTLITQGWEARTMSLKIWVLLVTLLNREIRIFQEVWDT